MTHDELNVILEKHKKWLNSKEGGERANLLRAALRKANLCGADLRVANLDFSCCPIWWGSRGVKVDLRIIYQLLAHVCAVECDDPEFAEIRGKILPYAKKSHVEGWLLKEEEYADEQAN